MIEFRIDEQRCVQCGECALDCPVGIIVLDDYPSIVDEDNCLQCQHCLAVCPTGAVSILGRNPDDGMELPGSMPSPEALEVLIKGRRSVRRYLDEDVAPELIDRLLAVTCHAPTGVNARKVLFTVVREGSVMNSLREEVMAELVKHKEKGTLPKGFAGQYLGAAATGWVEEGKDIIFRGAPHLLVTSAPDSAPCPIQDTHIALTTFQLLAHAHGLGTVWDGMLMMALPVCYSLTAKLGIPGNHIVGYAMAFGKPAVEYHRTVHRGPAEINIVR